MTLLDRLAERMGIEPSFLDSTKELQTISPATKRALLGVMGLPVGGEADAKQALARLAREDWSSPLPPVRVVRAGTPHLLVPLTFATGARTVAWTVRTEAGETREGTASPDGLELTDVGRIDGLAVERRLLRLEVPPMPGYHRLHVTVDGGVTGEMSLIVAPDRCHVPDGLDGDVPIWGISAQLYLLRSERNWGIGDFTDLRRLVVIAADLGASIIGLNPLHTMFLDDPERASPYSPASRIFLNVLYIDVTAVPEWDEGDALPPELDAVRAAPLVDYTAVARLKLPELERLFARFQETAGAERRAAFAAFRAEGGEALDCLCRFQALREHFVADGVHPDWRQWPEAFRDRSSEAVAGFARDQAARMDCLAWMLWIADAQLGEAAAAARARGMTIGLYRDLAVGADTAGAETWSTPDVVLAGAHVGVPPDLHIPSGQDWGLPPFDPEALRREAYAGFIELVRANMRHAGGLRIDHVMALQHLYWIPAGEHPREGAYVSYPMEDMLGILALESQRQKCLVVGEDLGTVPEGFRERMEAAGILSYRVVAFEQDPDGTFVAPGAYPRLSLATAGSHDLATLRGWWQGRDLDLKETHGKYADAREAEKHLALRAVDRAALIAALRAAEVALPAGFDADSDYDLALSHAVHAFLARSEAGIAMAQLDDLTDEADQVNLPTTTDEHPNWRRKQSLTLEEIAGSPLVHRIAKILADARPGRGAARGPSASRPAEVKRPLTDPRPE